MCLRLLQPSECPDVIHALSYDSCTEAAVERGPGTLCEGDGQCGTTNGGNNCGFVDGDGHYTLLEYYRVENCTMPPNGGSALGGAILGVLELDARVGALALSAARALAAFVAWTRVIPAANAVRTAVFK